MSGNLEFAKKNYSEKLNAPQRVIEVPEWGTEGNPLKIFVKPATLYVRDKIYKAVTNDGGLESLVDIILVRSLDSLGQPMFDKNDKVDFMNKVDPDIIVRVATEINSDMQMSIDKELSEAEKNF